MKHGKRAIALGVVALTLAACSSNSSSPAGGGTTGGGGAVTDTITLTDNAFSPADVTVSGTQISLVNDGQALHNVSIEGQDIDHDVQPGETESEDFELAPGTYTMFCKYHRSQGMEGTLTIQ
ncbi:MAG TPA: cupredoxin domain-containing protein [Actinomycetota bacterium]|jgi:plastocyanin